jgi:hypothetical protein
MYDDGAMSQINAQPGASPFFERILRSGRRQHHVSNDAISSRWASTKEHCVRHVPPQLTSPCSSAALRDGSCGNANSSTTRSVRGHSESHGVPATTAAYLVEHRRLDLCAGSELCVRVTGNWRSKNYSRAIRQLAAIRAGVGIGIHHDYAARPEPDLVWILQTLNARRSYWLATHEHLHDVPRVRTAAKRSTRSATASLQHKRQARAAPRTPHLILNFQFY